MRIRQTFWRSLLRSEIILPAAAILLLRVSTRNTAFAGSATWNLSNGNIFQASYTGGTGNDLTLTVVPP